MKNKKLIALLSPLFVMFLAGCAMEFPFIPGNPTVGSNDTTSSESTSESTSNGSSNQGSSSGSKSNSSSSSSSSSGSSSSGDLEKTQMRYKYSDVSKHNYYTIDSFVTIGSPRVLLIPIWFTDSTTYISSSKKEDVRSDIQKAYFGSKEDTGWHSVASYYEEESQGQLTIQGTVSSWYEIGQSSSTYAPEESGGEATVNLVNTASDWYFTNNPSDSRSNYDYDNDGYLDAVVLIYAAPDYAELNDNSKANLWAYCFWTQEGKTSGKIKPNVFFWASYDFMYSSTKASSRTGKSSYGAGDTSHCNLDAHTFIHEFGHVMGLDDYYDYSDTNVSYPAGCFSMQDYNVGGHDAFSVMALGWANPYIPTESCEITIGAFQKTHDLILLTPEWNSSDSPFDEYLLLELYTPTGLNKFDTDYTYNNSSAYAGPTSTGIRLWHVDARMYKKSGGRLGSQVYDPTTGNVLVVCSNTPDRAEASSFQNYKLLHLIRNDKTENAKGKDKIVNSDLFGNKSSFSLSSYSNAFVNKTKLNNNKTLGWSFSISITGSGENATAKVTLNRD